MRVLLSDWKAVHGLPRDARRRLIFLVVTSVVMLTGNWLSFIYVVNQVSLQAAAFAYMVCPIITALFAFLLLKEPISRRKWIALTVSAVSVLVLASGFMREVSWSVGVATLFDRYLDIQRDRKSVV